ncbi:MAG: autotransporter-associated beta strand repeat-containing protein, partial [Gemmataceae bacterium]
TSFGTFNNRSVVQFNPSGGTTYTTGTTSMASLRITPTGSGASLVMNGSTNLGTNALMLDGPFDFAITGGGELTAANSTSKYLHVNNPNTTLSIGLVLNAQNGTAPSVVFAGPGFVELTSTTSQNTLTGTNRFVIAGGTVRANDTQVGFTSAGHGVLSLTGGVLEIKNGSNGTGASADFTRAVGSLAGNVTWGAGTANEIGSGGISAFGSAASVNLGGNATPTLLQWNSTDFVGTGYALKFGSTQSNAVLTFLNPIQIEQGTGYQLREIQVIGGAGGDRSILAGRISGSSGADLLKTGTGTLELSAANTYTGNTWVAGGNLFISGSLGQTVLPTGTVTVQNGGTLSGTGTINGTSLVVNSGGTLAPGGLTAPGTFTVSGDVTLRSGSAFSTRIQGAAAGSGYDQLLVTAGNVSLNGSYSALFSSFTPSGNERLFVINNTSTSGTLTGMFSNYADGAVVANYGGFDWKIFYGASANSFGGTNGNDVVLAPFAPVPEPTHILGVCALAAAAVGLAVRRFHHRLATPA